MHRLDVHVQGASMSRTLAISPKRPVNLSLDGNLIQQAKALEGRQG